VAIVGAGPTGLSLALGLARHGVPSVLLEQKPATSEYSKAPGIHIRTREIFRQWGVEDRILTAGLLDRHLRIHSAAGGDPILDLDFADLEREADRPGLLILEQGETERLLLEAVCETGLCEVRFDAEVVGLDVREDGATLTVREGGAERSVEAAYVVGCDGASSFVRKALGLPFDGITYSLCPVLADVRVADARDRLPSPRILNGRRGLTLAIRLRPHVWRIIQLDLETTTDEDVPRAEVLNWVEDVLGCGPAEIIWASRFRIHRRAAPRFRVGRVLLAGDAAHVHSPAGGQGMNAGIQDAHNLAWKLAAVLQANADTDRLLDSYDVERREVVVGSVSRYTDVLTRGFLQAPAVGRSAVFYLLRLAMRIPAVRRRALRRMTMLDLGYSDSPLLRPGDRAAGMRLPNPLLRTSDGCDIRLYDLLPTGPALLDLSGRVDATTTLPVDAVICIGRDGHRDPEGLLSRLLRGRPGWILMRPDRHVAWAREGLAGSEEAARYALGLLTLPQLASPPGSPAPDRLRQRGQI
jgi:2-polyprenyl-6-methoxyphenol hydroxylase-like FAD-dependent oxidoreductase